MSKRPELNAHTLNNNKQINDRSKPSCPICFELFEKDLSGEVLTNCGHSFCKTCLQQALQMKPICPICRQPQSLDERTDEQSTKIEFTRTVPLNLELIRVSFSEEITMDDGRRVRRVCLSNGERTNIFATRNAKINIGNRHVVINGKRVENPSECNQQ